MELETKILNEATSILSQDAEGRVWRIVLIQSGLTADGRHFYPADVLEKAVSKFEGVRVFAYQYPTGLFDHLPPKVREKLPEGAALNLIGWVENVRFEKFRENGEERSGLVGDLHLIDERFRRSLLNAYREGKKDLVGFSWDGVGKTSPMIFKGKPTEKVEEITEVNELTLVTYPNAGGRFLRLVASIQSEEDREKMSREKLIEMIKSIDPKLLEGVDLNEASEEQLLTLLEKALEELKKRLEEETQEAEAQEVEEMKEAEGETAKEVEERKLEEALTALLLKKIIDLLKEKKVEDAIELLDMLAQEVGKGRYGYPELKEYPGAEQKAKEEMKETKESDETLKAVEEMKKEVERLKCSLILKEKLAEEKLPTPVKQKIEKFFEGKIFTEEELEKVIKEEREVLAALSESGIIRGLGDQSRDVKVIMEEKERKQLALDLLVGYEPESGEESTYQGIPRFRSLLEAYREFTGDSEVDWSKPKPLQEAVTADFAYALGTSMTKRMVKEYRRLDQIWKPFVTITEINNFKQQEAVRWGGFANLSVVAEGADYSTLATPSEERATYTPAKRGGLFDITREMILNDDIRALRQIPVKLARAAANTLNQFVFDLIINYGGSPASINGGTIYDGTALYTAAHGNLGSTALSYDALNDAIEAVMSQTEADSGEILGIMPKYLIVPVQLRSTALILVTSERVPGTAENDINILKGALEVVVSKYLRGDANNWYLICDPADGDWIEIGFVGGKQEPEILVQDVPTAGSMFTADKITYKVRHEYGGAVLDYRGFFGAIVA